MKKTKLLTTLGAVALIGAIGIGSTFAYLTSETGTVKNTFTVGNVKIDLKESKVVKNSQGQYVDDDEADTWTVTENKYENLIPGDEMVKDPTVIVEKSEVLANVFVAVKLGGENGWTYDSVNRKFVSKDFTTDAVDGDWTYYTAKSNNTVAVFYQENVDTKADKKGLTLFSKVTYAANATNATVPKAPAALEIRAAAVQAGNLTLATGYDEISAKLLAFATAN